MEHGEPGLLTSGKHIIRSSTFVYKRVINLPHTHTILDSLEIRVELEILVCINKVN